MLVFKGIFGGSLKITSENKKIYKGKKSLKIFLGQENGLKHLSPKTTPHSSLEENKFVTWNSLWEHPGIAIANRKNRCDFGALSRKIPIFFFRACLEFPSFFLSQGIPCKSECFSDQAKPEVTSVLQTSVLEMLQCPPRSDFAWVLLREGAKSLRMTRGASVVT